MGDSEKPLVVRDPEKGEVEIQCLSLSPTEYLTLLCIQHRPSDHGPKALRALGLTIREAEILYWMAEGKKTRKSPSSSDHLFSHTLKPLYGP